MSDPALARALADAVRLDAASRGLMTFLGDRAHALYDRKESNRLHQGIATVLDMMHVAEIGAQTVNTVAAPVVAGTAFSRLLTGLPHLPTGQEYLTGAATTIGPVVSLPTAWMDDPAHAMTRLLVVPHEIEHVNQWQGGVHTKWSSVVTMPISYLVDGMERVRLEVDAYAVSEAIRHWLTGSVGDVGKILDALKGNYAVSADAAALGADMLTAYVKMIEDPAGPGIPPVRAAVDAIGWLNANFPELKGRVTAEGRLRS